jgi:hypothetical protein
LFKEYLKQHLGHNKKATLSTKYNKKERWGGREGKVPNGLVLNIFNCPCFSIFFTG